MEETQTYKITIYGITGQIEKGLLFPLRELCLREFLGRKKGGVVSNFRFAKLNKKIVMIVAVNLLTDQEHLFTVGAHLGEGKRINFLFRTHNFQVK